MSENTQTPTGNDEICVILSTCPAKVAREIAGFLVGDRHAACVNILPAVTSVYRWEGRIEEDTESLLVIKCARAAASRTVEAIIEKHPYDVPEVVVLPVDGGNPGYLEWVRESARPE